MNGEPVTDRPTLPRVDRDEVFLEYTKSICPVCKVVVDAEVNIKDGQVVLSKRCRDHGPFAALVSSDAEGYMAALRYNKPGTLPLATQTEVVDGCPLDCGMCPDHKQHACLGILEVNSNCNLDCPICFADSGHQPDHFVLTMGQIGVAIDAFVKAEGEPEVIMFSGGEPTIHPHILDAMQMAYDKGVRNVTLNSNGIRLAHDRRFVAALGAMKPKPPGIYLQFDGLREDTHLKVRNRDLRQAKQTALDNCAEFGLTVTLAAAIERDVNDDEVGDIVRFGIGHPAVRAVAFQPVTHSGRHLEFDPMARLTNADVVRGLVEQCPDWFKKSDFFPVPCCFPTCRSITYLLVDGDDVVPIPRLIDLDAHLDYVTNRALPDFSIREALEKLWSASALPGTETSNSQIECATCGIDLPDAVKSLTDKAFMIVIQDFQDPYTLNVKQLMKCCVEELTHDGRIIPFCAYNSVGYREQVKADLTGKAVAPLVPNSSALAQLLLTTASGARTVDATPARRDQTNVGKGLA
ncbi:MAG: radical SAM protein [Acidimicrobiales bacterium]